MNIIKDYINNINVEWQVEVCEKLNQIIREAIPDVEARIQYRKPHYLKNGKYAAVFGTAKAWVSMTIFNATSLDVSSDVFEKSDNADRVTIKIRENQVVDYEQLTSLIKQASDTI